MINDRDLLTAAQTRRRLGGVSNMWIHRRLLTDPQFPKPIQYAPKGPRFWWSDEIDDFIESNRAGQREKHTAGEPRLWKDVDLIDRGLGEYHTDEE